MVEKDNINYLNDIAKGFAETINNLKPNFDDLLSKLPKFAENMQPKYIKEGTINKKPAKISLMSDDSIKIEFKDPGEGENFYKSIK